MVAPLNKPNMGIIIPQDCSRDIKCLFPVPIVSFMNSCFNIFKTKQSQLVLTLNAISPSNQSDQKRLNCETVIEEKQSCLRCLQTVTIISPLQTMLLNTTYVTGLGSSTTVMFFTPQHCTNVLPHLTLTFLMEESMRVMEKCG